jgi:hypothetical protein
LAISTAIVAATLTDRVVVANTTGAVHASDRRGRICPALLFIASGSQVVDLLQHVENDGTQHHSGNEFHGDPPWCADLAPRESWV